MDILLEKRNNKFLRPAEIKEIMDSLPDGYYMMSLSKGSKRSLEQNAYYRAMLQAVCDDTGNSTDDMHAIFKDMFLKKTFIDPRFGEITKIGSTTSLTTKGFADYITRVELRLLQNGYILPTNPNQC